MMSLPLSLVELLALVYFLLVWTGFARYAKVRAGTVGSTSLSRNLRSHRETWVEQMLARENRIGDASLLANQERVVGFFASTTILLLAAVVTALSSSEQIAEILTHLPYTNQHTLAQVESKLLILAMVLVYAFFKLSWSLRQYGFLSVLMGSAPAHDQPLPDEERQRFIYNMAKLMDLAGHDNNSGLRSYYFAIALLSWLVGTLVFVLFTSLVVVILYNREFRSSAVLTIRDAHVAPSPFQLKSRHS